MNVNYLASFAQLRMKKDLEVQLAQENKKMRTLFTEQK